MRKSSSSVSVAVKSSITPTGLASSASRLNLAIIRAAKRMIFMSAAQRLSMPGRWTLNTTWVPSSSSAVWTWAIDADARGFSTILVNRAARSGPRSSCRICCTSENGNGRTRSSTFENSFT